jgi:hypothetical protein
MSTFRGIPEDALSRVHVPTSRTNMAFERLQDFLANAREMDSNRSLLVLGDSGTGKTHLIKRWLADEQAKNPDFRAYLSEVPPDCTVPGLAARILEDLGDPDPEYGQINARTSRIVTYARDLDVMLIDEYQRLVQGKTERIKGIVSIWIASLLNNRHGCPIILAGERSALQVFLPDQEFGSKDYIARRTLGPVFINPWDWNHEPDRTEYRGFLHTMDGHTGLARSDLHHEETALRFHVHSRGRPGQTVRLITEARTIARRRGRPKLTYDILADAVDRLSFGTEANSFRIGTLSALEALARLDERKDDDQGGEKPGRGRRARG